MIRTLYNRICHNSSSIRNILIKFWYWQGLAPGMAKCNLSSIEALRRWSRWCSYSVRLCGLHYEAFHVWRCPALCLCVSSVLLTFWSPCLGKRELVFVLIVLLFVSYAHVNFCHVFSSFCCQGLTAISACALPRLFCLPFCRGRNADKLKLALSLETCGIFWWTITYTLILTRSSPRDGQMQFVLVEVFRGPNSDKSKTGPITWTVWNILIKFCIFIDINKL